MDASRSFEEELIKLCGLDGRRVAQLTVRVVAGYDPQIEIVEYAPDTFEPVSRIFKLEEVTDDIPRIA